MIWTTWRQHRAEALIVALILVVLAAMLIVTGMQIHDLFQSLGVGPCLSPTNTDPNCGQAVEAFRQQFDFLERLSPWLNLLPLFAGMLVGAPLLAREIENRTHLLAWTQSVTRRRWLSVKLVGIIGAALIASAIFTALMTWWRGPFDQLEGRLPPAGFDFEGAMPMVYIAFGLALAIALGTLLRRTIPAMLATIGGFLVVRLPIEFFARAYLYQAPLSLNLSPLTGGGPARVDWILANNFVDQAGHTVSNSQVYGACLTQVGPGSKLDFIKCVADHHWLVSYVYQPADRFLRFQVTEIAIYAILTALLLWLTYWVVQRRIR
jgi:hypothetical protein